MPDHPTKRCAYCAEEIRAEARKCRYCGSFVEGGSPLTRTWYRSRAGRMIAGVCAGLADQFGLSVTIVRLAFLLGFFIGGGMGLVIYLVLWVVMPLHEGSASRALGPRAPTAAPDRVVDE